MDIAIRKKMVRSIGKGMPGGPSSPRTSSYNNPHLSGPLGTKHSDAKI